MEILEKSEMGNMRNLYTSKEWKSLNMLTRAQLLLVIEGLKRGVTVQGNRTTFLDVTKGVGLDYLCIDAHDLEPSVIVSDTQNLHEYKARMLSAHNATAGVWYGIDGWLHDYPDCCIEEYAREMAPAQAAAYQRKDLHLIHRFGEELTALIQKERAYPDIFDYLPLAFTPCSIHCEKAISKLTAWKDAILTLDPEAGRYLVHENRCDMPQMLVHGAYLAMEKARLGMEHRVECLRQSFF